MNKITSNLSVVKYVVLLGFAFIHTIQDVAAQTLPQRTLLALSKTDRTLSVIDPSSLKIIAKIPVGPNPHEVVASSDGKTAYVSNPGNSDLHEINVIDLVHLTPLSNIDTSPLLGPHGLAYVNGSLWFTAQGSKAVGRYNAATLTPEWVMGTGQDITHMIYVKPDGNEFYTTNVQSGTVSIFENVLLQPTIPPTGVLPPGAKPHMDWVQTLIPVGTGAEGFDVSPDGKELWTVTPEGRISIIGLAAKKLSHTIDTHMQGAHRLKYTPDGSRVVMVSVKTGEVAFFDTATRKEVKRITMGQGATMLMDSVGNRLFVSCSPNDYIAVIDLKKMEVTGRIDAGGRPDGLAWAVQQE